jgi:DNA-binding XRE family transcriptional regulator/tetrahydromethanopterin S-methyltransferase subunit G
MKQSAGQSCSKASADDMLPDDVAGARDHPLVMQYDIPPGWLDSVRHRLPSVPRRHEMAQAQILAAAIDKARDRIPTISYSRRREYYAKRGKRYDPHPDLCSYDLIVPNVDLLAEVGFLFNEIAPADPTSGRQSVVRATPALIEALGDMPPAAAKRKPRALIQLRDEDKLPIDYRDTDDTTRMRRRLLRINEMVESVTPEFPPNVGERRGDLLILGGSAVNLGNTALYRVFNIDFNNGGRFYGHFVQGLPKKIRELLTFSGEHVSEPDYPAHHLRILYALEGHTLTGDPYEVNGWERRIVKVALLIMINAPTWQSARGAIVHRFGLSPDEAQQLVHALEHRHAPIAKHFQSGAGRWLQWYDSRMTDRILIEATREGIPVLPIHDSFITPGRHGDRVLELMETAFRTVIFGSRAAPPIMITKQELIHESFHIRTEIDVDLSLLSLSVLSPPPPSSSNLPALVGDCALFDDDRRITVYGRTAVVDARRRRAIRQDNLANLVGVSRPTLSNILAGRFGASSQTAERIAEMIATTPAFERQPFLPGLAA